VTLVLVTIVYDRHRVVPTSPVVGVSGCRFIPTSPLVDVGGRRLTPAMM
jgi:hypothetical protein